LDINLKAATPASKSLVISCPALLLATTAETAGGGHRLPWRKAVQARCEVSLRSANQERHRDHKGRRFPKPHTSQVRTRPRSGGRRAAPSPRRSLPCVVDGRFVHRPERWAVGG